MQITHGKKFEKPQAGNYVGTVIDLTTLENVASTFNGVTTYQNKVRVTWVLGPAYPGQAFTTKEGKPFEVIGTYNMKLIDKPKKSKLYELLEQMLQATPPMISSDVELENLTLGRSNQLFLVANANPSDANDPYINVAGLSPLAPGQVPPQAPAGFVRFKNRVKTTAGPAGQPVQTYAQRPAVNLSAGAPAPSVPTASGPEAF